MSAKLATEPNVTPMIDVMLVLLIIFMVVAPMLAGIHATPPAAVNLSAHPDSTENVTLGMDAFGQYYLNERLVSRSSLDSALRAIYAGRDGDHLLYINADRRLDYAKILDAMDLARGAGITVVGMIAIRPGGVGAPPRINR